MTYKGYRIDKKLNVYDLREKLVIEKAATITEAKEQIDNLLEEEHKKGAKNDKK